MKHRLHISVVFLLVLPLLTIFPQLADAQCGSFYDGFESGTIGPAWSYGTGTYTRSVSNTGSPVGNYHVVQTSSGSGTHYQGMYATFTPAQPTYFSWWIRSNTTSGANGYVVIGNSSISSDNGILFCYITSPGALRFYNTSGYNHPISPNTWYHVECRNVNWTTRTMEIWVDNALILSNWAFRSTTAMNVDRVHMYNLVAATAEYDEIQIGLGGVTIDSVLASQPVCYGDSNGSISLTASSINGGVSYAWSTGDTSPGIINLSNGTYTVSITDSLGCSVTDSFTMASPSQVAPVGTVTNVLCPGGSGGAIDVTVSGGSPGYTYLWSNGATTEDLSNLNSGTYVLTVTDVNGCEGNNTFGVSEPSPFVGSAMTTPPICFGGSNGAIDYTVSGGSPGYTYLWSNGATTEDLTGIPGGVYTVLVTDSVGCNFQDSVALSNPSQIMANGTVTPPTCFSFGNGRIDIAPSGGTPVYTYVWSTGASSQNLPSASAGTYTVTITDANGCTSVDTFVVTQPAQLAATANVTHSTGSNNGAIDLTVTGGTPPFTYNWSNGGTTQDITGLAGNTNYGVTVTDVNGCTTTGSFFVDEVIAVTNGVGTSLTAWPNPFENGFTVELSGMGAEPVQLSLCDLTGRQVWQAVQEQDGRVTVAVELAAGVYLLRMQQGGQASTVRMMKH